MRQNSLPELAGGGFLVVSRGISDLGASLLLGKFSPAGAFSEIYGGEYFIFSQ
jgi:hypothetical protein